MVGSEKPCICGFPNLYGPYLGITQNRVSTLKVKKELKYPYAKFNWKKSFERISKNAQYENGKIKMHIPDKNLYLEIKNFVESEGGYIDVQLNTNLLQISPECFIDLMMEILDEQNRKTLCKKLKKKFDEEKIDTKFIEEKSVKTILKGKGKNIAIDIIMDMVGTGITTINPLVGRIISNVAMAIKNNI